MNFQELQRELASTVKDQSPTVVSSFPDFINEAIQAIAEEVPLPTLKVVFLLTTSTSLYYVNTPTGFSGKLRYVGDSTGKYSLLDGGLEQLVALHTDLTEVGDIQHMALEGNVLYYLPIPSVAVSLTCVGYNFPATLSSDTSTPTDIPEFYHRQTIVNKAAELAYAMIEAGETDDKKVNTNLFAGLAQVGITKLHAWATRRRSNVGTSCWRV